MKTLTGPINCALCGFQTWNGRMVEAVPDGGEPQYICKKCFDGFGRDDHISVVTSHQQISQEMTRLKHLDVLKPLKEGRL